MAVLVLALARSTDPMTVLHQCTAHTMTTIVRGALDLVGHTGTGATPKTDLMFQIQIVSGALVRPVTISTRQERYGRKTTMVGMVMVEVVLAMVITAVGRLDKGW